MVASLVRLPHKEIAALFAEPLSNIGIFPQEDDIRILHLLVIGSKNTPYAGGFFFFVLTVEDTHPESPPIVKCMTFDAARTCLHPRLQRNGTVRLGLLATDEIPPFWNPKTSNLTVVVRAIARLFENE